MDKLLKILLLFFLFLIPPAFAFGGMQKESFINAKINETKVVEILLWSEEKEILKLEAEYPQGLVVIIPNPEIQIDPLEGNELVIFGNKQYNATKVKIYVTPLLSEIFNFSLRVTSIPKVGELAVSKGLIFRFTVNASQKLKEVKIENVTKNFELEKHSSFNFLLIFLIAFIILLSYLIYKFS